MAVFCYSNICYWRSSRMISLLLCFSHQGISAKQISTPDSNILQNSSCKKVVKLFVKCIVSVILASVCLYSTTYLLKYQILTLEVTQHWHMLALLSKLICEFLILTYIAFSYWWSGVGKSSLQVFLHVEKRQEGGIIYQL